MTASIAMSLVKERKNLWWVLEWASRAPTNLSKEKNMDDLIEALTIFKKYVEADDNYAKHNPTHCEHDVFMVCANIKEDAVSDEDKKRLDELSFAWNGEYDCWSSYRFGSC